MSDIPTHVGIIADGNRRWAKARHLPSFEGHRQGVKRIEELTEAAIESGVKYISFFVFSTENWKRTKREVSFLMNLISLNIKRMTKRCLEKNIRVCIMGRENEVPPKTMTAIRAAEKETANCTKGTLAICFNYGGQWEIADAATKILNDYKNGRLKTSSETTFEITPEIFSQYLYHPEIPPCDLIIRTSGEERISGFQLWRSAYSEFYFSDKNFPDFDSKEFQKAITNFTKRQRNFGK